VSNEDFGADSSNSESGSSNDTFGVQGNDSFTETTSKSWSEKTSDGFLGVFFGLIMVIAAGVLMFWNEGRSARTSAALHEGAGRVIAVVNDYVDPANEGKLVHVAGETAATQPVRDADFGFGASGLRLTRKVEMYQWDEHRESETRKQLGGGEETVTTYTYTRKWSDRAIDSSQFRGSGGHRNPPMPGLASRSFAAPDARLGAFALNERVISLLPAVEDFDVPASALGQARARLGPRARVEQGLVYVGGNPDLPMVGDVRVTWRLLPVTPVSVVARQTDKTFSPWLAGNGGEVILSETGVKGAALLFKHGHDKNRTITWIWRFVSVFLMFIGFRKMLSLLVSLADVIPLLGDIVGAGAWLIALVFTLIVATAVIGLAWLFYRPLIAGLVIGGGIALVLGLRKIGKRQAQARGAALAPRPRPNAKARSRLLPPRAY